MARKYFLGLLIVFMFFAVGLMPADGFAYPSTINILPKKDIVKLSDQALTEAYLDTIIEIQANNVLHKSSGFNPKEFQEYKSLLRFRYELKAELQLRQLDIPVIE